MRTRENEGFAIWPDELVKGDYQKKDFKNKKERKKERKKEGQTKGRKKES